MRSAKQNTEDYFAEEDLKISNSSKKYSSINLETRIEIMNSKYY